MQCKVFHDPELVILLCWAWWGSPGVRCRSSSSPALVWHSYYVVTYSREISNTSSTAQTQLAFHNLGILDT